MTRTINTRRALAAGLGGAAALLLAAAGPARASDHLDTPSVIADPRADIGDIFAWTSPDRRKLNLVMAIVGHGFSKDLAYVFHVDSGARFGRTTATTTISCRFAGAGIRCEAGGDEALGDASRPEGLVSRRHGFRVFAGLRDDPFFNNVKGTREAYDAAAAALKAGAPRDEAGCPAFDQATSARILDRWRHTRGGPAQNLLAGWTPASLVVSIDLPAVSRGGGLLAVWGETVDPKGRIDRMGRPLTGNALLATLEPDAVSDALKEAYNHATPATSDAFIPEIEKTLGLYDAFDGECGNAVLADRPAGASRYLNLAVLLADDRLWIDSAGTRCTTLFAVELAALAGRRDLAGDCGGRTPNYDAVDVYRSLLATGGLTGVDDGVDHDDHVHSDTVFPFLAAPDGAVYPARKES
ncbi:DUF4331 family protein [Caulobacter sp. UNC279MFTsu5.1]|uniref:DUF4331 family protein n=1 Tax=Caulobacter sp. UNC279MFTsu5.1 TaxID=1502775 RepID=UPI0008E92916|nr:DUF4331 family protein [Caulobacter sp. UNC279MFTsu5.1]SFJ50788.1 protein of unknown function [Caulobacter sp. UNC279MFTsu5.1]